MNKIYSILFLWLCQVALFAQVGNRAALGGDGKEDDSGGEVIQEPIVEEDDTATYYTIQTTITPDNVRGYTNWQNRQLQAGESVRVYTYAYNSYQFQCWKEGETVLSTDREFLYTMPAHDVTLTAVYKFDPTSPANPEKLGKGYTLSFVSQPIQAGEFNIESRRVNEGGSLWVDTWSRSNNYQFMEWQLDGQTISKDQDFEYVMPGRNVTLTAVYKFAPSNPDNPGKNEWDKETGKIIVDDFREGELNEAIYQLTREDGDASDITEIVVVGKLSRWDFNAGERYPSCTILDFSRTTGLNYVPGWCYQGDNFSLTKIALPSSITWIDEYAFNGCATLSEVSCYAVTPPELSYGAFEGISEGAVLYVPAASIELYEKADGWKDIFAHIMPLQEEVGSLSVTLPNDSYKGLYLELINTKSGQKMRYLITDRTTYTFANLMDQSEWKVYLKNAQDVVLAESNEITIEKPKTSTYEFKADQIQTLRDLTLRVMAKGQEVTDQTTVRWFDAQGTFLNQSNQLTSQMVGTELKYQVILPQALGELYKLPTEQTYTVADAETVTLTLEDLPKVKLTGYVHDVKDYNLPLAGAVISVSQMLNGLYSKSQVVSTDKDGNFSVEICDTTFAPALQLTASKPEYISQRLKKEWENYQAEIAMQSITGATITLGFTYQKSTENGHATPVKGYDDAANISYQLYNKTKEAEIAEFSAQEGKIVLLEPVDDGDVLEITATSRTSSFEPIEVTATITNQTATATFAIVQLGQIMATYGTTSDENTKGVVGMLYDGEGNLVASEDYANNDNENVWSLTDLADGDYTLITMAKTTLFNSVNELSQIPATGLVVKQDYLSNDVKVQSGKITPVKNGFVPNLDETKLYYTGSGTAFTANKTEVTIGNYLTLSARIDFKALYADQVSDVELIIDLPKRSKVVDNSVMTGNSLGTYEVATETGKAPRVTIPLENYRDRIRFCFIPTVAGNFSPSAYVRFKYNGRTITQPIGSAPFTANALSINAPSVVATPSVPVSGVAFGNSTVEIYDDDVLVGQTTALANGSYAATVQLYDVEEGVKSDHKMYAHVTTVDGTKMQTETKNVTYDKQAVQVDNVTMFYSNPEINQNYKLLFDFQNPSTKRYCYTYYIYNRSFTFTIKLTGNAMCDELILYVKTGDGRWNKVKAEWNDTKGVYVANASFGNMYDGIVPVNVRVYLGCGAVTFESGYPDCDVPIDPSGYVYEAVPSNRLQGVTATAYYKETTEDQFGDKHESVVLWDAEKYAQENPLFTDENGMYRWDVPAGLWQVKFEKDGYVTTYSDWLPVPPPQLDVNIAMTQNIQPSVADVKADENGVEVIFDKYMLPETLVPENFVVTKNGEPLAGTVEKLDEEAIEEGSEITYVSRVKFIPADGVKLLPTDVVKLIVNKAVKSYAGIPMEEDKHQDFDVVPVVTQIVVDDLVNIANDGSSLDLIVAAQPVEAAHDKKLTIKSDPMFVTAKAGGKTADEGGNLEITLDEQGQAKVSLTGEVSGFTTIAYSVEDSEVKAQTKVKVVDAASLITVAPIASRASGEVYRGDQVALSTQTEDAKIYYTLDGTEPTGDSYVYSEPIEIDEAKTIKAMALGAGSGLKQSDTKSFDYTIKQNAVDVNLAAGWNWISHNLADAQNPQVLFSDDNVIEVKSQTKGLIRDDKFGLVGNLTKLLPTETYKVKTKAAVKQANLQGDAFNTTTGTVALKQGWNWMGYPVYTVANLDEAFAKTIPTEGDLIIAKDGTIAEYTGGAWTGSLQKLEPGKGYMYKAVAENSILFNKTLSNLAKARSYVAPKEYQSKWVADVHQYPNVMPIAADLYVNGVKAEADAYSVAAFCDTECRGVGEYVKGVLFLGVQGEGGEKIKFYAMNNETEEVYDITEQMEFTGERQGSYNAPFALNVGDEATEIANLNAQLQVSPAVARDQITVTLPSARIDRLSVYNTGGVAVISASNLDSPAQINVASLTEGVYIVVVSSQGKTYYQKIVKRN